MMYGVSVQEIHLSASACVEKGERKRGMGTLGTGLGQDRKEGEMARSDMNDRHDREISSERQKSEDE